MSIITTAYGVVESAAMVLGWMVLLMIGCGVLLAVVRPFISFLLWSRASDEGKQFGANAKQEHGFDSGMAAMIHDSMLDVMANQFDEPRLKPRPRPLCTLDWSIDEPRLEEIERIRSALSEDGYVVHPFPKAPRLETDDWDWSQKHAAVWKQEPDWYLVDMERVIRGEQRVEDGKPVDPKLPEVW